MKVLRDEKAIERRRKIGQFTSLLGMAALIGGLILAFTNAENVIVYQLLALSLGWILSQVGVYLSHRYLRRPRPDEVIDDAVRKVARNGRMYHYLLPAPHVLLTPTGVIVFVAKYQGGDITADGDKWKQKGIGFRRFFGQEGLGNPSREAETQVKAMASYIRKHAPSVEEVLIAPLIVFTTKNAGTLDLERSNIPAMYYTKLKGFLREQRRKGPDPMPPEDYEAIKTAFDRKAAHLLEEENGEDST